MLVVHGCDRGTGDSYPHRTRDVIPQNGDPEFAFDVALRTSCRIRCALWGISRPRQWTWGAIDAMYHVLGLVVAAVILALIR